MDIGDSGSVQSRENSSITLPFPFSSRIKTSFVLGFQGKSHLQVVPDLFTTSSPKSNPGKGLL